MKALLLWPIMPNSFWSYQETLDLALLRSTNPPLGLITVAAMLPGDWELRFCDRNVSQQMDADWDWCDMVIISAMIIQQQDFRELIQKGVALGKKVAVGGPFPTSVPEFALDAGAHYLILDEGECTIPMFLQALARGMNGEFSVLQKNLMSPKRQFLGLIYSISMHTWRLHYNFPVVVRSNASFAILSTCMDANPARRHQNKCCGNFKQSTI
jgi:radical SAM superfamily enzyme YgiQ (UPF0313 family)